MSLPRSFRRESWFVRFPTGEIDVLTGAAVARGLEGGTLAYDTPVCAVGSQVWLPLRVHATTEPALSFTCIPTGDEEVSVPMPDGPWRVRDAPAPSLAVRRAPLFAGIIAGAIALVGLAVHATASLEDGKARALVATMPAPPAIAAAPPASTDADEARPAPPHRTELTPEQRRRLLAHDRRAMAQLKDLQRARNNDWARLRRQAEK